MKLHKVLIQSLSFSNDEQYLASLGGQDDNSIVIWEVSQLMQLRLTSLNSWQAAKLSVEAQ
jgi:WD40 repeat protein